MFRTVVCAVAVATSLSGSARAEPLNHPPAVTPDGASPLPLAAEAARVHLLGAVEMYTLALYVEGPALDRQVLASPDVAKALRIEITYEEDLRRRLPFDWRRELVPRLEPAATTHLRGSFAPVRDGDVVLIEYAPGRGTTVRVNKGVAVSGAHHDLMLAFLDHWLGQRPVSEEIKRQLLRPFP